MLSSTGAKDVERIRLTNSAHNELELWIEPFGERLTMPSGATFEVELEAHANPQPCDRLTVEISEGRVTLYGWVTSVFEVRPDGSHVDIWPSDSL